MKKYFLIHVFISIQLSIFAQAPVLDFANFVPKVGDSITGWNGSVNFYDPGSAGSNIFWDFSNINFQIPDTNVFQQNYSFFYSNPSTYYPIGSNLVSIGYSPVGNEIKKYYYADVNKFILLGDAIVPVHESSYSPAMYILKFPFTYLSEFSDSTMYYTISHNYGTNPSSISNSSIHYNVLADGWGSLKILNITHTNVLRVRNINQWIDTVKFFYNGCDTTIYYNEIDTIYRWYKPNKYAFLMTMSTKWDNKSGVWTNTKMGLITPYGLNYLSLNMGVKETDNNNSFTIYPNPATSYLTINLLQQTNLQNTTVSIYDVQKKLLLQQTLTHPQTELNIASFAKGIYVIKVNNDNNSMQSKFVKE